MATLNSQDFKDIQQRIRSDPAARAEFKTWPLTKQQWYDLFQAAETWFVSAFTTTPTTSFKAALAVVYPSITNAQAKQIAFVWMGWRFMRNP